MTSDSTRPISSKPDRKSARSKGKRGERANQPVPSVLAADLTIDGNIASGGDVHIDGTVNGDVQGASVVVGEHGRVDGELQSEGLTVHGQVNGTVRAREVALSATARIDGDVYHETLEIERGAGINGQLHQQTAKAPDKGEAGEPPPKGQPLKVIAGESGDGTAG